MSSRRFVLLALCFFGAILAANAQQATNGPCIECQACQGSNNCLAVCLRECPQTVDLDRCVRAGRDAVRRIARESCDLTQMFCRGGGQQASQRSSMRVAVSLSQCGNAAFGECQRLAKDFAPLCSFGGTYQCDTNTFNGFYNGEIDERCNKEADRIEKEGPGGSALPSNGGFRPLPSTRMPPLNG